MAETGKKHKDIARIDQNEKRTHGWYVRVRYLGKNYSKFFSDRRYGGTDKALDNAVLWRNETEKKIGKPRTDRHIITTTKSSKSSTGVVGVRLNLKRTKYDVSWVFPNGKQGKTTVSIRKHGQTAAFKIACDIRRKREAERLGQKYIAPPVQVKKRRTSVKKAATVCGLLPLPWECEKKDGVEIFKRNIYPRFTVNIRKDQVVDSITWIDPKPDYFLESFLFVLLQEAKEYLDDAK